MTPRQMKAARNWLGMSAKDVAALLGCSIGPLWKIENGQPTDLNITARYVQLLKAQPGVTLRGRKLVLDP